MNCEVCGEPATCFGKYAGEDIESAECDECCDHSQKDGSCRPLTEEDKTPASQEKVS